MQLSFDGEAFVAEGSPNKPTQQQLDTQIQTALMQPSVETFLLILQSLPADDPFSMTSSVIYATESQEAVLASRNTPASLIGALVGASAFGFLVGAFMSFQKFRRKTWHHESDVRHKAIDAPQGTECQSTFDEDENAEEDEVEGSEEFEEEESSRISSTFRVPSYIEVSTMPSDSSTKQMSNRRRKRTPKSSISKSTSYRIVEDTGEVEIEFHQVDKSQQQNRGYDPLFQSPFMRDEDGED